MDDEEELVRARTAARREVVRAVLWAAEHGEELAVIASAAPTRHDAVGALTRPPHGWSDFQAQHILDTTFGRLSQLGVADLRDELEQLDRGEDTSSA